MTRVLGVVAALSLAAVAPLRGQLEPVMTMRHGQVMTLVRNGTPDVLRYDVEVLARTVPESGAIILGRPVAALISPRSFTLGPGGRQILRIRLREAPPTATLGLAISMTPASAPADTGALGLRITIVLRHVAKVLVE